MGVKSILRSITNAATLNVDKVAVNNLNNMGAWLLENDFKEKNNGNK